MHSLHGQKTTAINYEDNIILIYTNYEAYEAA
jgi:hypothetical protein